MVIYNLNIWWPQQNLGKLCNVIIKLMGHRRAKAWKDTPSQKLVNYETHRVFLVCEVNQWVILFDNLLATHLEKDNHAEKTCYVWDAC